MRASAGVVAFVVSVLAYASGFGFPHIEVTTAQAQSVPKSLEEGGAENALRARKNQWTVGVAGGQLSGTYMTFADEMAQVLDDGDNLRILPIVTYGAASNLDDLLYLRGVDVGEVDPGVEQGDEPGMVERPEHAGLGLLGAEVLRIGGARREHLDRHVATEELVAGAVDEGRAALADDRAETVAALKHGRKSRCPRLVRHAAVLAGRSPSPWGPRRPESHGGLRTAGV